MSMGEEVAAPEMADPTSNKRNRMMNVHYRSQFHGQRNRGGFLLLMRSLRKVFLIVVAERILILLVLQKLVSDVDLQ